MRVHDAASVILSRRGCRVGYFRKYVTLMSMVRLRADRSVSSRVLRAYVMPQVYDADTCQRR